MLSNSFRKWKILVFILISSFLFIPFTGAEDLVDIKLRRTFGMAFGNNIQGTFTVVGSGSENIVNLTLQFDNVEVLFSDSNSLLYRFKTKVYEPGELNITLLGYDAGGSLYTTSKIVNIMTPIISIIITAGIILIVVISISIKYGPRIVNYFRMKKDNNRKNDSVNGEC